MCQENLEPILVQTNFDTNQKTHPETAKPNKNAPAKNATEDGILPEPTESVYFNKYKNQ